MCYCRVSPLPGRGAGGEVLAKTITMTILTFGVARDIVGSDRFDLTVPPGTTTTSLKRLIRQAHPGFDQVADFAIARNATYAGPEEIILPTDEVVILPPVSGG